MKKKILCLILCVFSILCFAFASACKDGGEDDKPVANAELDEYNQIVSQMKDAFTVIESQPQSASFNTFSATRSLIIEQEEEISSMFTLMQEEPLKQVSEDIDYYAYGIDFSTMTARIAGYAANNFFKLSTFYDKNILMDYGFDTIINACVKKDGDVIKTYLFTQYEDPMDGLQKEYNYTEIKFTSQTDFKIVVVDYTFDEQNSLVSNTMIYASSQKDFFLISGMADTTENAIVFFDKGASDPSYIIEGKNLQTIYTLYDVMQEKFAISIEDKNFIASLYNTQEYSIDFSQVMEAKNALGIVLDMEQEGVERPVGFISNKNAEDLIGRKTLQAFVDDGESVQGTTLTIPSEFNYLSGGIYFDANIDTLIIPSTVKGVVIYDRLWNYKKLDDSLCYYEAGDEFDDGYYKSWGGTLTSYVSGEDGFYDYTSVKPFKKYVLLDEDGNETTQTEAFILDEMGNLWIKDSTGKKNYLWGFTSQPNEDVDTWRVPSPTFVKKDKMMQVEHFACEQFLDALRNVGELDSYTSRFKHIITDAFIVQEQVQETGAQVGFNLINNTFLKSFEGENGIYGFKWDLETFTINGIIDGAKIDLTQVFCSELTTYDQNGVPTPRTVCHVEIDKVILNGDFDEITFINGYAEINRQQGAGGSFMPPQNGEGANGPVQEWNGTTTPDGGVEIKETHAIGDEFILNGNENATFTHESIIFGQKVLEVFGGEIDLPCYPDIETLVLKNTVRDFQQFTTLFKIGVNSLPADRKLTIEFENIAGIEYSRFYIYDLMDEQSTRVEKVKFNVSSVYMANLLNNLEFDPSASWVKDIVNSNKYIVEYATPTGDEQAFFDNYTIDFMGNVSLKETSSINIVQINDEFLSQLIAFTGKSLNDIGVNLYKPNGEDLKIVVNVSKTFLSENGGKMPAIYGGTTIEIVEQMKSFDNLTGILDSIFPSDVATLVFNGTKEELIARGGELGIDYVARLLFIEYYYYSQISFSDGETVFRNIDNKTVCYEDDKIKIEATLSGGQAINYVFTDKINTNVQFTSTTGEVEEDGNENSWFINVSVGYNGAPQMSKYYYEVNGIVNERNIIVPVYEVSINYVYGHTEDGGFNYVYGNSSGSEIIQFTFFNLPSTITLS